MNRLIPGLVLWSSSALDMREFDCPVRKGAITFLVMCLIANLVNSASVGAQDASVDEAASAVDYLKQVKPLLRERCVACHGVLKQSAGLRLDTVAFAIRGGDSGAAITPSDTAASLLLERVTSADAAERMPPEGEPLTAEQIAALTAWISAGASHPADERPDTDPRDHWAYRPLMRPEVPAAFRSPWVRTPLDAFIAQRQELAGLTPQPEASRLALLRRVSLDLIGLPPTPAEIAAVQSDAAPDWYERLVERLLADPRHGERWGRHWMDVWRYSDWWGLGEQLRNSQAHIWHWRDWILESLNNDLPYDEMVRQMLAADELYPNDLGKLRATGLLARNYFLFNRNQWMEETVEHVSKGFLGLTVNCAKCHDHKYDPISQTDFYRLRAFFEPYHVRLDIVPGEADLVRDGVPRVFDGVLDAPTYRFIRGQENSPDKSRVIEPGLPEFLGFALPAIEAVELPREAWQPEVRPWVAAAHLEASRKKLAATAERVTAARNKLAAAEQEEARLAAAVNQPAEKSSADDADAPDVKRISEKFAQLDTERWQVFGGDWSPTPGKLEQRRDGPQRAALRLREPVPADFDATLKFTILGGSQWRSVGIAFDSTSEDPSQPERVGDSEQNVYVSAVVGGSKVQAAWHRDGAWQFPAEGAQARPIELKREYTLRVQVRGQLINASLDGEPVIAFRTPLDRRAGRLQLITFDVLAVFHEFSVEPLASRAMLREPGTSLATPASAARATNESRLELQIAELALATTQAELKSLERQAEVLDRERTSGPTASGAADAETRSRSEPSPEVLAAVNAERELAVARTRQGLAEAELRLLRAPPDQHEAKSKEVAAARELLDKSVARLNEPGADFTRLSGARWTATRFLNSGQDDPAVNFPSRSTGRRRALAAWMTDRRNPLTARVAVNHVWMRHFGVPLAPTVFDLGLKGQPPVHRELLDWLASEFVDSGWSFKHLHRLITRSAVYRLSSSAAGADDSLARDRDNALYWRRTPARLESQAVRDVILALAGSLDATIGGPPVMPAAQAGSPRRSLYFFHSNNERNLFLTMFDEALVKECYRREQSIVPQQALALSNSQLVLDSMAAIADRLSSELASGGAQDEDDRWIRLAFATVLGAEPSADEMAAIGTAMEAWRKLAAARDGDATRFARAQLIWVLLNHNDFVSVR